MSGKLRLNGATSGYSELQAPDVAGDQTYILPSVGGELVTKQSGGSVVGYQQGLWTPTMSVGTASLSNTRWFRIGNAVTVFATLSQFSTNTSTESVRFLSIPYTNEFSMAIGSAMYRYASPEGYTTSYISNNAIFLYGGKSADWKSLQYNNLNAGGGATEMYFTGTYLTDDTTWIPINGATIS